MAFVSLLLVAHLLGFSVTDEKIGIFDAHSDIGEIKLAGSASYDGPSKTYTVVGSGLNMWSDKDAFHYVYKKVAGNQSIEAVTNFIGPGKNAHRKACLIIRQSLDANSAYADIAVHGDGLTSLQYRKAAGGTTHEVQSNIKEPTQVKLTRIGNCVFAGVNDTYSGASVRLDLTEDYFIGIGRLFYWYRSLFSRRGCLRDGKLQSSLGLPSRARRSNSLQHPGKC